MAEKLEFQLTLYPQPVLRKVAEPVEAFDPDLEETVRAMLECMYRSKGVGLAAPQVGLRRRILCVNPTGEPEDELILVNCRVTERAGPKTTFEEGCLSFPGIYAEVERPERCTVEAQDLEGNAFRAEYDGFVSRIVQHEYDHLEGVLLVDRMSPADKLRNKAALEKLVEQYRAERGPRTRTRR
jgi:peptide deformylase